MCKFHKDVARAIAMHPVTGAFNPNHYAIALTATAKFRIEQYMPVMFGCDGYNPYEVARPEAIAAFQKVGLKPGMVRDDLEALRSAMEGVTFSPLNLPVDPVSDTAFLDEATVELFDGYTAPGYAANDLTVKTVAHSDIFEPLRAATEQFLAQPGVEPALRRIFEDSVARVFTAAPGQVNRYVQAFYNRTPKTLREKFKSCAMCVGGGAGGVVLSHAGCLAIPFLVGGVSGAAMSGVMMVASPAIAAGVTWSADHYRGQKTSALRLVGAAVFAFAVAAGMAVLGDPGQHQHHHAATPINPQDSANMCVAPR